MFSGITQGLFTVKSLVKRPGLLQYSVVLNQDLIKDLTIGASVAIDGVCQTVVGIQGLVVSFEAIQETLTKTTLNALFINRQLSVERSMRCGDELGGHELSGHVFETAVIVDKRTTDNNLCLTIQCSKACFAFIKPKAYIAVEGSSLTIGLINKKQCSFEIHLIPETVRRTNFANKNIGDKVNLEPDMKIMMLQEAAQDYFLSIEERLKKIEARLATIP